MKVPLSGLCLLLALCASHAGAYAQRPNILWITAEDMSPNVASFGDTYAVTPHIDRLAAQGVRYTHAFAPSGVCAPSRSSIILGVYASAAGAQHMRSAVKLPESVRPYSRYLREAGYFATNNAKEDYNLDARPAGTWDDSSNKAHWRLRKDPKQPFFAVFNFMSSHESQIRMPEAEHDKRVATLAPHERHDPARAPLPPYHPDRPEVRRDWARYADNVTFMDRHVGELLRQLEADGLADDTIVFFYTDHGAGMPRSKRWLYDGSLRVPLVVRFPPPYQHLAPTPPGGVTDRLVSLVDVGPTALSLAGVPVPPHMHGEPFLGAQARPPRRYVHAFRDRMDERYDMVRAVRDHRWLYIRNFYPHRIYGQRLLYLFEMPTMQVWQRMFEAGQLRGAERSFFLPKPTDELYDTWADPHQVTNLAADPDRRSELDRLRAELDRWMTDIRDTGLLPEAEMLARAQQRTPWQVAHAPKFDVARLLEAAKLATLRDRATAPALARLLRDHDAGVRFWGATGLAALGGGAKAETAAVRRALKDVSANVRIAAAEVMLRIGGVDREASEVLRAALADAEATVQLHALNVIDLFPDRLRQLRPDVERVAVSAKVGSYPARLAPLVTSHLAR